MKKVIVSKDDLGKVCSYCKRFLTVGEYVISCDYCNEFSHENCYNQNGCYSDFCKRYSNKSQNMSYISISKEEVSQVIALPSSVKDSSSYLIKELNKNRKTSKLAVFSLVSGIIAALICAIGFSFFSNSFLFSKIYTICYIFGTFSLIIGTIALARLKTNKGKVGIGFGITGLSLSALVIIFTFAHQIINLKPLVKPVEKKADYQSIEKQINQADTRIKEPLMCNVSIKSGFSLGGIFSGSGVVIRNKEKKTYIITNKHVIDNSPNFKAKNINRTNIFVTFYNGKRVNAEILWVAPNGIDLALLMVDTPENFNSAVKISSIENIKIGEKVFAIGNPMGLDWSYTEGVVSSLRNNDFEGREVSIIQIQTPLNHGNSGGGLYKEDSTLVGINTFIYEKAVSEGLNFSIAIDEFIANLDKNIKEDLGL